MDYPESLKKYLAITVEKSASDLHLAAGYPPIIRINGELWAIPKEAPLLARVQPMNETWQRKRKRLA